MLQHREKKKNVFYYILSQDVNFPFCCADIFSKWHPLFCRHNYVLHLTDDPHFPSSFPPNPWKRNPNAQITAFSSKSNQSSARPENRHCAVALKLSFPNGVKVLKSRKTLYFSPRRIFL